MQPVGQLGLRTGRRLVTSLVQWAASSGAWVDLLLAAIARRCGSAASLESASRPVRPIRRSGPAADPGAPQTALAATDVVRPGGAAVLIVTLSPASARLIAVVRPLPRYRSQ